MLNKSNEPKTPKSATNKFNETGLTLTTAHSKTGKKSFIVPNKFSILEEKEDEFDDKNAKFVRNCFLLREILLHI